MSDDLTALRAEIDALDRQLVGLLARRAQLVGRAWAIKAARGLPRHDDARERAIYADRQAQADAAGLDPLKVRAVLETIIGVDLRRGG